MEVFLLMLMIWRLSLRKSKLKDILPIFFDDVKNCSALCLNHLKCIFIDLSKCPDDVARERWNYMVPKWKDFSISKYGKYLGFLVGPGANNSDWDSIERSILEVAQAIHNLGLSKFQAILLFQILGVSKLMFISQLREPRQSLKALENNVLSLVIGGPGAWRPVNFIHHLKEACSFPISMKHFF